MQAQDIMTRNVITATADATVEEVTALMMANHVSAVPIIDEDGIILGLVSEGDLMRRVEGATRAQKSWWLSLLYGSDATAGDFIAIRSRRVKDVMTRSVIVINPVTPVAEIARLLEEKRIKRVPVIKDGRIVGIVSRANLLQALAATPTVRLDTSTSDRQKREIVLAALAQVPGLIPAHLNVVVDGGRVDVWGLAGSDAEINAARVALDNIQGLGEVSVNLGRMPNYAWGI
ncbi:CBS domain-containing protein (plasmid) [Pseudohalocynthiibacter aestuariivivens]|nr:CBS domain-containing protein [Pseudohalocynthiibacter aestuariivivens]QIE47724.1 CBS domain-containing protein [Pseudohalocynthiibacter aestuariivivens]